MYYNENIIVYKGYILYRIALISFSKLTVAIYGSIEYKKKVNKIISAIKLTNYADALTSIVVTQCILQNEFGTGNESQYNGTFGVVVSSMIFIVGCYMVISSKNKISISTYLKEMVEYEFNCRGNRMVYYYSTINSKYTFFNLIFKV